MLPPCVRTRAKRALCCGHRQISMTPSGPPEHTPICWAATAPLVSYYINSIFPIVPLGRGRVSAGGGYRAGLSLHFLCVNVDTYNIIVHIYDVLSALNGEKAARTALSWLHISASAVRYQFTILFRSQVATGIRVPTYASA